MRITNGNVWLGDHEFLASVSDGDLCKPGGVDVARRLVALIPQFGAKRKEFKDNTSRKALYERLKRVDPSNKTTLSVWLKNYNKSDSLLSEKTWRGLARSLIADGIPKALAEHRRPTDIDLPLWQVFLRRAQVDVEVVERMSAALSGEYQMWVRSTTVPGGIVMGLMKIYSNETTPAIYVDAEQHYVPRQRPEGDGLFNLAPRHQYYRGYLIPLDQHQCIYIGRSFEGIGFDLAIFTELARLPSQGGLKPAHQILSMRGGVIGTADGGRAYFSPIYVERLGNAQDLEKHQNMMNIYNESEIPDKICRLLKQPTQVTF